MRSSTMVEELTIESKSSDKRISSCVHRDQSESSEVDFTNDIVNNAITTCD